MSFPKKGDKVLVQHATVNAIDAIAFSGKLEKKEKKPVTKIIVAVYLDGRVKDTAGDVWKVAPKPVREGVWKAVIDN